MDEVDVVDGDPGIPCPCSPPSAHRPLFRRLRGWASGRPQRRRLTPPAMFCRPVGAVDRVRPRYPAGYAAGDVLPPASGLGGEDGGRAVRSAQTSPPPTQGRWGARGGIAHGLVRGSRARASQWWGRASARAHFGPHRARLGGARVCALPAAPALENPTGIMGKGPLCAWGATLKRSLGVSSLWSGNGRKGRVLRLEGARPNNFERGTRARPPGGRGLFFLRPGRHRSHRSYRSYPPRPTPLSTATPRPRPPPSAPAVCRPPLPPASGLGRGCGRRRPSSAPSGLGRGCGQRSLGLTPPAILCRSFAPTGCSAPACGGRGRGGSRACGPTSGSSGRRAGCRTQAPRGRRW